MSVMYYANSLLSAIYVLRLRVYKYMHFMSRNLLELAEHPVTSRQPELISPVSDCPF